MEKNRTHQDHLEDEWYHVRHSGEIPEVVLHSSLHYLTQDSDGPNLTLLKEDHRLLHGAACARYREIILRDIIPENRDTSVYRGLLRTICNWRRFKRFCKRYGIDAVSLQEEVAAQLNVFLLNELAEVAGDKRGSCLNCTYEELHSFGVELAVVLPGGPGELEKLCMTS